jgi:serine/threonine protein phosphatase 1
MRSFAIGDIHGCALTFKALVNDELQVLSGDTIYLLGDLVDRGPDTKSVIDEIFSLRERGVEVHVLRGNHEEIMLKALDDEPAHKFWLQCGGKEVLDSFGVDDIEEIPEKYIQFIQQSILVLHHEPYYFVHAGFDFSLPNPLEGFEAMLWIRKMKVNREWLKDNLVVHGHTPEPFEDIQKQRGPLINLDGGCVFKSRPDMGYLVALNLHSGEYHAVKNID